MRRKQTGSSILSRKNLSERILSLDKDILAQTLSAERKRKAVDDDDVPYGREGTKFGAME